MASPMESDADNDDRSDSASWPPRGFDIDSDGHWQQVSETMSPLSSTSYTRSEVGLPPLSDRPANPPWKVLTPCANRDSPETPLPVSAGLETEERQLCRMRLMTLAQRVKEIENILQTQNIVRGYRIVEQMVLAWVEEDGKNRDETNAIDSALVYAADGQGQGLCAESAPGNKA